MSELLGAGGCLYHAGMWLPMWKLTALSDRSTGTHRASRCSNAPFCCESGTSLRSKSRQMCFGSADGSDLRALVRVSTPFSAAKPNVAWVGWTLLLQRTVYQVSLVLVQTFGRCQLHRCTWWCNLVIIMGEGKPVVCPEQACWAGDEK